MDAKVFPANGRASRAHRYRVEFRSSAGHWALDETYRTYLMARMDVAVWNSLGHDARIIDTRSEVAE